ncbi:hypothetical protein Vretimale_10919 [Volvox reticuliferus]|uniref:UBC core domain-containing protein n=1 Tax=Volvox reticuliferus TaxID=1737510 RepID=A0A8J4GFL4_9CHLO|nr:hypothetical protein Vretifemale_12612 [Volvox reticuliferus]GIM06659.1 hypothetical protein Vretimale_10919 [Volvox reticuliferus]
MSLSKTGRLENSGKQLSHIAIQRLQRDLKVWEQERGELRIPVALGFSDSNFTTLYINFKPNEGPYKDEIIHIHAHFPADYPDSPPNVRMMTPGFSHPNVFPHWFDGNSREDGAYICLDMIKSPKLYARPYSGWSAAYDICGLVLQLYSFLIGDDKIDQDWGGSVSRAAYDERPYDIMQRQQQHAKFECHCGFTSLPESPPSPQHTVQAKALPTPMRSAPELPGDIVGLIVNKLDACTLTKIAEDVAITAAGHSGAFSVGVTDSLSDIALQAKQEREIICFYHKTPAAGSSSGSNLSFGDDDVLGFGVAVARHYDGNLKSLSMAMDLLSYGAFHGGVRRSAWNMPFDAFIPLALNVRHAAHAIQLLPRCVGDMLGSRGKITDEHLLEVLARLMNSLVVEMVFDKPQKASGSTTAATKDVAPRHMSDAALKGFCHLHHLLLTVALAKGRSSGGEGALLLRCQHDVLAFVADRAARHKSRCPDLGLLLIKYVLVPKDVVPWSTFAPVFVRELLARHVMWVSRALKNDGGSFLRPWQAAVPEPDLWRLQTHLKHSRTSLMTVAVESFFVNALARPDGNSSSGHAGVAAASNNTISPIVLNQLADIKATYDKRNGEPPSAVFDAFSQHARSVLSVSKWTEVLAALRLGLRPPLPRPDGQPTTVGDMARQMADTLRQAVLDSRLSGYHTDPQPPRSVNGAVAQAPWQYIDWEGSPPVGVVSEDWRYRVGTTAN